MLNSAPQAIYNIYNWLTRKLRSTALNFIALFNKEYADSRRLKYVTVDLETDKEFDLKLKDLLLEKTDINLANNIELITVSSQKEELIIKYVYDVYGRESIHRDRERMYNLLPYHRLVTAEDIIVVRKDQRYSSAEIQKKIVAMFPSAERAIKDQDFMRAWAYNFIRTDNSGYNYQGNNCVLYELVTNLQTGRKNLTEVTEMVDDLMINYEKYDSNRDLVFLLKLVCKSSCYDESIRRVITNHKINSRDAMIEEICSLQKEEMLCVNQKKLDCIIKMLPILEKKSHESYGSIVTAVRSEGLGKLEEILANHTHTTQEKIKTLTGKKGLVLNVKPVSTLEFLSIAALEKHRLLE